MTKEEFIQDFSARVIEDTDFDWYGDSLSNREAAYSSWKDIMLDLNEITQEVHDSIGTLPNEYK